VVVDLYRKPVLQYRLGSIRWITEQLWPLGDDVTFIPGHGPLSTFGEERESSPFIAGDVISGFWTTAA